MKGPIKRWGARSELRATRASIRRLQGRKRFSSPSPHSIIYILAHFIIFLLGTILIRLDNVVAQGVGASLIAAAATGWVLFVMVVMQEGERRRRDAIEGLGLVAAFPTRSIPIRHEYDKRLERATSHIDIMGYGLSHLREEYLDQMEAWTHLASVRILLVDPDTPRTESSYVSQRDVEEGLPDGETADSITQFLTATQHLRSKEDGRFQVRLCKAIPSINMFRVDYEAFWGPYLVAERDRDRRSRNFPTLLVDHRGFMFLRLCEHFNTLWESNQLSHPPTGEQDG